jgi:P-type Ca2+ transporter type 2C
MSVSGRFEGSQTDSFYFKGSIEAVLSRCVTYYVSETHKPSLDTSAKESVMRHVNSMSSQGLRILGIGYGPKLTELTFVGCVAIYDPPRKGLYLF